MKIAIYNCFAGQPLAESGLSRRISLAAANLGWTALETQTAAEINHFNPDFVLALHFFTPKLTQHPTYGCMWSPPAFFENVDPYVKNVLSYDGFLSSSTIVTSWLENRLRGTGKPYFIAPFYTSCHSVAYEQPDFNRARLLYAGTNWDGFRFRELFHRLDSEPYMEVYGPAHAWRGLRRSYKGLIPIDGISILSALRAAGAGLCLHRPEHCEAETPSLRIFEIAASGAIAICQDHPFIRSIFGDAVLYLDSLEDVPRTVAQMSGHMQWIRAHPEPAAALSRRAYEIFSRSYTFEKLLAGVLAAHESQHRPQRNLASLSSVGSSVDPAVDVLVFAKNTQIEQLRMGLESICQQDCGRPNVLVTSNALTPELQQVTQSFSAQLAIRILVSRERTWLSSAITQTFAPYVAILQPGEVWFPHHLRSLIQTLDSNPQADFAYSGAIRINQGRPRVAGPFITHPDPAELGYFEPLSSGSPRVPRDLLLPGCFLARRELLQGAEESTNSIRSPQLLFLCWISSARGKFTYQATMSYSARKTGFLRTFRAYKLRRQWIRSSNGGPTRLQFASDVQDLVPPIHRRMLRRLQRFLSQ